MNYTLETLSQYLQADFWGTPTLPIDHACGLDNLKSGGIAYLIDPSVLSNLPTPGGVFSSASKDLRQIQFPADSALIVPLGVPVQQGQNLIYSRDPQADHVRLIKLLHQGALVSHQIDPRATLGEGVSLGKNVTIDAGVVLYQGCTVGDNTVIRAGCVLMEGSQVGSDCLLYPNVTVREKCTIGNRVIIHANAVIGSDGFGYFQREGINHKIPQIGVVIIEDDVEIGSCTTIDRAKFHATVIGKGSKIDNLVHIAHNVELGPHSLIAAQSGIAGSTKTGSHLMMGGQTGIRDNLKIGNQVSLLARTLVTSNTTDGASLAGMPSRPIKIWRHNQALINTIDSLVNRIRKLEEQQNS